MSEHPCTSRRPSSSTCRTEWHFRSSSGKSGCGPRDGHDHTTDQSGKGIRPNTSCLHCRNEELPECGTSAIRESPRGNPHHAYRNKVDHRAAQRRSRRRRARGLLAVQHRWFERSASSSSSSSATPSAQPDARRGLHLGQRQDHRHRARPGLRVRADLAQAHPGHHRLRDALQGRRAHLPDHRRQRHLLRPRHQGPPLRPGRARPQRLRPLPDRRQHQGRTEELRHRPRQQQPRLRRRLRQRQGGRQGRQPLPPRRHHANPVTKGGDAYVLQGTTVYISTDAAALLDSTFKTTAVTGDLKVGIATLTVTGS